MKLEIDIPDWCADKNIYILAGIELAAYRHVGSPWMVKTGRCNQCGQCCMNFKVTYRRDFPPIVNRHCMYLQKVGQEFTCVLGVNRPFKCSIAPKPKNITECTETFEPCE